MSLQTFITLLVIGALAGLSATFVGKNKRTGPAVNLMLAIAGGFLGWFVFHQISRTAIDVLFALGGSLLVLGLVRAIRK